MAVESRVVNFEPYFTKSRNLTMESKCSNPECKRIRRELEEELKRVKSVGYDMLKQRGGWQSTGRRPTDFSLEFDNFFSHEVEDMIDLLKESSLPEDKARRQLCSIFQKIYDNCKDRILRRMEESLRKIFSVSENEAGDEVEDNEDLYDTCRAYGLLLHASGVMQSPEHEDASQEACATILSEGDLKVSENELKSFTTKVSQLSWNLLTAVPPLVSAVPDVEYRKGWHEKEMKPMWDNDLANYDLVYYRPVLFLGQEGKVTQKGWVGNQESINDNKRPIPMQQKVTGKKTRRPYKHSWLGASCGVTQATPTAGGASFPHSPQHAASGWRDIDSGWKDYLRMQEEESLKWRKEQSDDNPCDDATQGTDLSVMFRWKTRM